MTTGEIIFCFLCILLIIASLHHIRQFTRCSDNNNQLQNSLERNYLSNQQLLREIHVIENKIKALRKVSAEKVHETREERQASNKLGKSASKLIKAMQDKLSEHQKLQEEILAQEHKNKEYQKQKNDKVLKPLLPPLSEQPYLLIEPKR